MKYFAIALVTVVAAKKKCNRDIKESPCKDGYEWNLEACACFTVAKCKMMCP